MDNDAAAARKRQGVQKPLERKLTLEREFAEARLVDPTPEVLLSLCEIADSPRSLCVWLLFKNSEFKQLVELESIPSNYEPVYHRDSFAMDHACTSLLSKFQDFGLGIDREEVAFQKWKHAEALCAGVNQRFRDRWSGKPSGLFPHHVEEVYYLAKRKIRSILREVDYDVIRSHCHFGPGADLDTRRNNTSVYSKFGTDGSCTPWVVPLYDEIFSNEDSDMRGEFAHRATLCDSSRLSFVPKNAKTDRAICVEPRWNIYLQLGIGGLIQQRLLRVGVDIRDQARNQDAARRAYVDGLATIDLSSASDTISKNLVIDLLSDIDDDDWLELLLKSRCPYTSYKGQKFRLEKLSSMGNGYTFPLETLIFYALAYASTEVSCGRGAATRDRVLAYGDDIIVPAAAAPLLIEVLGEVGFTANKQKTFQTGYFFESCGKDYWRGYDIRPFFIKENVTSVEAAYKLCNQIARFSEISRRDYILASRQIWHIRQHVIRRIPKSLRLFGPSEAGSGLIHTSFDVSLPRRADSGPYQGYEGYTVRAFVAVPVKKPGFNYYGHLYSKLSADVDTRQYFTKRDAIVWRLKVVYVPTYTDYMLI